MLYKGSTVATQFNRICLQYMPMVYIQTNSVTYFANSSSFLHSYSMTGSKQETVFAQVSSAACTWDVFIVFIVHCTSYDDQVQT